MKYFNNKKPMPGRKAEAEKTPPQTSRIRAPVAELTLRELEALAGTGLTGFLTLFHAAVAGKATGLLESGAGRLIGENESAGETVADGAGLTGNAAALCERDDVNLGHVKSGDGDGLLEVVAESLGSDVFVESDLVDGPDTGTFNEIDAGGRGFATACSGGNCFLGSHFKLSP